MGFLGDLFKSSTKEVEKTPDFSQIHRHLDYQKEYIRFLHDHLKQLHDEHSDLSYLHQEHTQNTSAQLGNVNDWIDYLFKNHKKLEQDLLQLETTIKATVKKEFEAYHSLMLDYIKEARITKEDKLEIKTELLNELESQKEETSADEFVMSPEMLPDNKEDNQELSTPEKQLLKVLFNHDTPMTYEDLARKAQKSINSIRVYMNSLKSKKDIIEEFKKPNGVKIFSIKNKERIRTLYNVH